MGCSGEVELLRWCHPGPELPFGEQNLNNNNNNNNDNSNANNMQNIPNNTTKHGSNNDESGSLSTAMELLRSLSAFGRVCQGLDAWAWTGTTRNHHPVASFRRGECHLYVYIYIYIYIYIGAGSEDAQSAHGVPARSADATRPRDQETKREPKKETKRSRAQERDRETKRPRDQETPVLIAADLTEDLLRAVGLRLGVRGHCYYYYYYYYYYY